MPNYNRAVLIGHMARDPETKYVTSGQSITTGAVAVSKKWKDKTSGETREQTSFIDFKLWGSRGDVFSQYVRKGHPIMLEGALEQESWTDKESGNKRSKIVVNVTDFQFLKSGGASGNSESHEDREDANDDVPF